MAEELRLWAITVDTFRQCFAAPPDLADTLRRITGSLTAPQTRSHSHTLLSKIGPLMRRPDDAPVIKPGIPNVHDAESIMTSRFIATDRLGACWVLARVWLDELADMHRVVPLARSEIDELEFDLARVGVPTEYSIRQLWRRGIDIPLRPADDMCIGYTPHSVLPNLIQQWEGALSFLGEDTVRFVTPVLEFVSGFPQYTGQSSPPPRDLIAWWTSR